MITYSAPASRSIAALTSPVNAPSCSQCTFWPATPTLELRAASATACSAVNGGATTISTSVTSLTRLAELLDERDRLADGLVHLPVGGDERAHVASG